MLLYRYFIAQGLGRLTDILAWFNTNKRSTFNPFARKYIGQTHFYDDFNTKSVEHRLLIRTGKRGG